MANTGVFYLARLGNHPRFSKAFLYSLVSHDPGADFELVYILKGYDDAVTDPNLNLFRKYIRQNLHEVRVTDEAFDINAYFNVSAKFQFERILFFNSYTRILAPSWLSIYLSAFERVPNCGVVGATSGYEIISKEQPFPNVSIRTNAFMIARNLLLSLDSGPLVTRKDCKRFEAGPNSLTRQIMNRGLVPVVIDRNGKTWDIENWPISRTFRSGNQEDLLIADNRTYDYEVAGPKERRRLAKRNWGDRAFVTYVSMFSRLRTRLNWDYPNVRLPLKIQNV